MQSVRRLPPAAATRRTKANMLGPSVYYPGGSAASSDTGEPAQPLGQPCCPGPPPEALAAAAGSAGALATGMRLGCGTFMSSRTVAATSAALGRALG